MEDATCLDATISMWKNSETGIQTVRPTHGTVITFPLVESQTSVHHIHECNSWWCTSVWDYERVNVYFSLARYLDAKGIELRSPSTPGQWKSNACGMSWDHHKGLEKYCGPKTYSRPLVRHPHLVSSLMFFWVPDHWSWMPQAYSWSSSKG